VVSGPEAALYFNDAEAVKGKLGRTGRLPGVWYLIHIARSKWRASPPRARHSLRVGWATALEPYTKNVTFYGPAGPVEVTLTPEERAETIERYTGAAPDTP
jgi:hypothetical protein